MQMDATKIIKRCDPMQSRKISGDSLLCTSFKLFTFETKRNVRFSDASRKLCHYYVALPTRAFNLALQQNIQCYRRTLPDIFNVTDIPTFIRERYENYDLRLILRLLQFSWYRLFELFALETKRNKMYILRDFSRKLHPYYEFSALLKRDLAPPQNIQCYRCPSWFS